MFEAKKLAYGVAALAVAGAAGCGTREVIPANELCVAEDSDYQNGQRISAFVAGAREDRALTSQDLAQAILDSGCNGRSVELGLVDVRRTQSRTLNEYVVSGAQGLLTENRSDFVNATTPDTIPNNPPLED